jgi:ATP-dependent DNA ligase
MLPQKVLHMYKEEAKKKPKFLGDYLVTEKLDGIYVYIDYINDQWQVPHSRAGRAIPAFEHLKHTLFEHLEPPHVPTRFIAEATHATISDFHTINGIFNRSVGDYHCNEVIFNLHDMVEFDDLEEPAIARLDRLYNWFFEMNTILREAKNLSYVHPILQSSDKEEWLRLFNSVKESGGEGIVLKHIHSPYYPDKRNSSLMKIKLEDRLVLYCVDIFYTVGEKGHSNLNATFRRSNGVEVVVRVGKHSDIAKIEEDRNYILGQPCLIECMCEVTTGGTLREPRFKNVLDRTKFPINDVKLKVE